MHVNCKNDCITHIVHKGLGLLSKPTKTQSLTNTFITKPRWFHNMKSKLIAAQKYWYYLLIPPNEIYHRHQITILVPFFISNMSHRSMYFFFMSVEVADTILTYILDPFWVIITLWQICHPCTNACRQLIAHCVSNSNCRLWRNLRTSEHIIGMYDLF